MRKKRQSHLLITTLFTLLVSGCANMTNVSQSVDVEDSSGKNKSLEMYVFPKSTREEGYHVKFKL